MATNIIIGVIVFALLVLWLRWGGVWDYLLRWLHVLWACRVSVVSVLAGYLLMANVPQAQDVFADTSVGAAFWLLFFVLAFFIWALPVHYAARRMLDREEWALANRLQGPARRAEQVRLINANERAIIWVPRLLGIACFGAIHLGMLFSRDNLAPAVRMDLVAEARERITWLMIANAIMAVVFAWFVIRRSAMMRQVGVERAAEPLHLPGVPAGAIGISESGPLWLERLLSPSYWRARAAGPASQFYADLFATSSVVIISGLFVLVFVDPLLVAERVPRAAFLVFMLGAPVVGLTWVAAWSHRLRAPLLLMLAFTLTLIATFSPNFHDARQLPLRGGDKAAQTAARQITLAAATARWMAANDCTMQDPQRCPSPIIVAGQGGASRAAFFTAGVIGELLRTTRTDSRYRDFGRQLFALSTVSGSSLAAVMTRAALEDTVDPARGEAAWREGPCGTAPDGVYFRSPRASAAAQMRASEMRQNWRACLQKLTAGDFLSPVFIGIAIRDLTSVPKWFRGRDPWWQDRAILLERAWERRYAAIVTASKDAPASARHPDGLERRFGYLTAEGGAAAHGSWIPLLFVNGSSVETGRRILSSDVRPWQCRTYPDGQRGVSSHLQEGYDLFEIVGSGTNAPEQPQAPCAEPKLASSDGVVPRPVATASDQGADFRLSTIATMSARFPIISPPGTLRNQDGNTVDRIIDGGFFENDGLATAADIADALIGEYGLRPAILHVTNEPLALHDGDWRDPRPEPSPTLPDARELTWFQSISMPIKGLYETRSGHGNEAANVAVRLVEDHARNTFCTGGASDCAVPAHYIRIAVYDSLMERKDSPTKLPKVSMSWWLSQPVQAYLDAQIEHPRNRCSLALMAWHLTRRDAAGRAFTEPEACSSGG
ncbi:MAG TPA: hypothetical protein VHN20_18090 [Beijerinckiaceae bacterium]|nr:hypothetical protein [Beijerinckiaceae bacterium]